MVKLNQARIGDDHNGGKNTREVVFVYTWYQGKLRVGCVTAATAHGPAGTCCCNLVRIDENGELRLSQLATATFSKENMQELYDTGTCVLEQWDGSLKTYRGIGPETDIVLEIMRLARKDERAGLEA